MRQNAYEEARSLERNTPLDITAIDIDPSTVEIAAENARLAGVEDVVKPQTGDAVKFISDKPYGSIICNPPYGERLGTEKESRELYKKIGKTFSKLDKWSYYILTSCADFENLFGKKANKKRKIYNGMLQCNIYQYFGERPLKTNRK